MSGSVCVSSSRCSMLVSSLHPDSVLNPAFCMTFSFCMFVLYARGDYVVEAYSRRVHMTAKRVPFCLSHRHGTCAFMICVNLCACCIRV